VSSRIGDIYEQIKEPALRVLYRHWDETRGGRAAPAVVEIDPAGLPVLHGSLAVIDTAERLDGFRFRYFGGTLRVRFRQERRDMTFSQIKRIGVGPPTASVSRPTYRWLRWPAIRQWFRSRACCCRSWVRIPHPSGSSPGSPFVIRAIVRPAHSPGNRAGVRPAGGLMSAAP
jgi:hypothetical protein